MVDNTNIDDPIDAIIIKYSNHPSILKINHTIGTLHFSFHKVELIDVLTEINMLSSTTSSNTYGIPTTLLKQFRDTCSESLLFVFNNCIEKSTFEKDLKYADITPTHKKDDVTNKANYRPISVLHSVKDF